jgi:hypothetical protein
MRVRHRTREHDVNPSTLAHLIEAANVAAPPPTPAPAPPPGLAELGDTVIAWMKWILMICGVAGLMWCGIMMTVGRRNRSAMAADGASGIPWVLGGLTCGLVAAAVVAMMLKL